MKWGWHIFEWVVLAAFVLSACMSEFPKPLADPWQYDAPWTEGFSSDVLENMDSAIKRGDYGTFHSLVIIREKKIIFENYYNGLSRDVLHPLDAATKSVVSVLAGILMKENSSVSADMLIIEAMPGYEHHYIDVPQKDQIRLRDIMSNSSGLWWDEWSSPYTDPANDAAAMQKQSDWTDWVLTKPMIREPGQSFNYNSGNAILTGRVIEYFAGTNIEEYAASRLFAPLGIDHWRWDKMSDGSDDTAWGLHMRPLDLAKIGYLFIEKGNWYEQQIFEERWARQSTVTRERISGYYSYGYQWWRFSDGAQIIDRLRYKGLDKNDVFFSWGRGGQMLLVMPSFDLVVVMTGGNGPEYDIRTINLLLEYIIPSIQNTFASW